MRDTHQYPITDSEIIECLETLRSELIDQAGKGMMMGDMRPLLLGEAIQRIKDNPA